MKLLKFFILVVYGCQLLISFSSHADLLISPTRVSFDERQRVAKVIVINNGDEYRTYRLSWQEKTAKPEGGYITHPSDQISPTALSSMVRMSPSQVRLAPGERQIVKLALRKPKNLADKEYRSHLLFQALPNEDKSKSTKMGIKINMILSYSIPVILRQGAIQPQVNIEAIELVKNEQNNALLVSLARKGNYSAFGKVDAFYKANNASEEIKVSMLSDYSIYAEVPLAKLTLNFFEKNVISGAGKLRIVYSGLREYQGVIFAEKTVNLNANSVGLLN
ncbi:molecular chaperone [Pseudoalteromonas sp. SG45-5]|uniref:fimbrial biogenesis chaperone n=1 Tax=unclassified Pseudoalteromonas TaxID=194690 RepID=UPI00110A203D|nr:MULTISPECIES: fimbria/pilus periplasmic chaperone [unclassified Pseudoalteromonas]MBB1386426.1 molecular chaperone [Pseudoalteromonas sp. SG45-5]MBB1394391.1 molecular chaperone [Pseudoalteromonas sp. SG44-4]MBB1446260.1 molecular chaperone [Pseudoalteromonas sp. SG41-6]TMO01514.1 molecular chaperone [Pseudoalteromonas sp. S558]